MPNPILHGFMRDLTEICYQLDGSANKGAPCLPVPGQVKRCLLTAFVHPSQTRSCGCQATMALQISSAHDNARVVFHSIPGLQATALGPTHSATPLIGLSRLRLRRLHQIIALLFDSALFAGLDSYNDAWWHVCDHSPSVANRRMQQQQQTWPQSRVLGGLQRLVPGELTRAPERCMSQV